MTSKKRGAPTTYSNNMAEIILALLMEGKSLVQITRIEGMPKYRTVCGWLARHDSFAHKYALARQVQADYLAEEILDIADTPCIEPHDVNWARNRIDARKWLASKIFPKKYGANILEEKADNGNITEAARIFAEAMASTHTSTNNRRAA